MKNDLFKMIFFSIGVFFVKILLDSFENPLKNSLTLFDCILLVIILFLLTKNKKTALVIKCSFFIFC